MPQQLQLTEKREKLFLVLQT